MFKKLLFILLPLILFGCPNYGYKYNSAAFPEDPINLEFVNSEYDDFNSTAPWFLETVPLVFSSNRKSKGGKMDFEYFLMSFEFDKTTGEFRVYNETNSYLDVVSRNDNIRSLLSKTNQVAANEYGPYIKSFSYDISLVFPEYNQENWNEIKDQFLMLYASDLNGDLDIYFHHNRNKEQEPTALKSINTDHNEAYPCFNQDYDQLLFCADKDGDYNIYTVEWDNNVLIEESLTDEKLKTWKELTILNSSYEDKCPYISNDVLVFTSDRPGGYGGFDLYYSVWKNNSWTEPVNFGKMINSEYDEFRPILQPRIEYDNRLMIFSSNRPGGLGGYDLYYSGYEFL